MTTPTLDPRFGKLVAHMESTTHEPERAAARARAGVEFWTRRNDDMELRTVAEIAERGRAHRHGETGTDAFMEDAILRGLDAPAARGAGPQGAGP